MEVHLALANKDLYGELLGTALAFPSFHGSSGADLVSSFHGSSGADLVFSFHGSSSADLVRWCCCALPYILQVLGFADRFRGFVVVAIGFC